jgi:hypothetical protein
MFWKTILALFLVGGVSSLFSAGLLRFTRRTLDLWVHDKYLVISPAHLLILSAIFLIATLIVWRARVSY